MSSDLTRARNLGLTSAVLGVAAGTAQLLAGTTVWTGNKNDPTTLGVVTVLLALIIAVASLTAPGAATTGRRLTVSVGLGIPALIGLTTAGPAWVPAAIAGVAAARFALRAARQQGATSEAVGLNWSGILLTMLAFIYLFLGATALGVTELGVAGSLGILGGLAVFAVLLLRRRSHWGAAGLLIVGTLPFAIVTWWSVVTPLTAVLMLLMGIPLILAAPNTLEAVSRHGPG